jgi:hypothetical protein
VPSGLTSNSVRERRILRRKEPSRSSFQADRPSSSASRHSRRPSRRADRERPSGPTRTAVERRGARCARRGAARPSSTNRSVARRPGVPSRAFGNHPITRFFKVPGSACGKESPRTRATSARARAPGAP